MPDPIATLHPTAPGFRRPGARLPIVAPIGCPEVLLRLFRRRMVVSSTLKFELETKFLRGFDACSFIGEPVKALAAHGLRRAT